MSIFLLLLDLLVRLVLLVVLVVSVPAGVFLAWDCLAGPSARAAAARRRSARRAG